MAECGQTGFQTRMLICIWEGSTLSAGRNCEGLVRPVVTRPCFNNCTNGMWTSNLKQIGLGNTFLQSSLWHVVWLDVALLEWISLSVGYCSVLFLIFSVSFFQFHFSINNALFSHFDISFFIVSTIIYSILFIYIKLHVSNGWL